MHLPVTIKEIQAGYLNSPYFNDIHLYLAQNKLPSSKITICKVEVQAERYISLSWLSMDLKVMPKSYRGHTFILCIIDEVTNYLITVPIYHSKSEEIGSALIEDVISKYCIPDHIIMEQDCAFTSMLMNYLFKRLNI